MVDSADVAGFASSRAAPLKPTKIDPSNGAGFENANGAACGLVAQLEERTMLLEFEGGRTALDEEAPVSAASA